MTGPIWLDKGRATVVVCCRDCPSYREVIVGSPADGWAEGVRHVQRAHAEDKKARRHAEGEHRRRKSPPGP